MTTLTDDVCPAEGPATIRDVLRKVMWIALHGVIGAVATMASRRAASRIWRILTGEVPPAKR